MKNTFILIFIFVSVSLLGQNPDANTEAYLTYGSNFLPVHIDDIENNFTLSGENFESQFPINYNKPGFVTVPNGKQSFLTSSGNFTVGYNIRKGKHIVGFMFNYERQHMEHKTLRFELDDDNMPFLAGLNSWSESKINNYGLAARYDFNWIFKDKLKVYSGLSLGGGIRRSKTVYYDVESFQDDFPEIIEDYARDKSTDFIYNMQLNAIGMRYGTDWALILEIGLGTRGFVNVGINHHLFASEKWAK